MADTPSPYATEGPDGQPVRLHRSKPGGNVTHVLMDLDPPTAEQLEVKRQADAEVAKVRSGAMEGGK